MLDFVLGPPRSPGVSRGRGRIVMFLRELDFGAVSGPDPVDNLFLLLNLALTMARSCSSRHRLPSAKLSILVVPIPPPHSGGSRPQTPVYGVF